VAPHQPALPRLPQAGSRTVRSFCLKGALILIVALTRVSLWPRSAGPEPGDRSHDGDGSQLRSGGETWGPVSPDNVHETGVSPLDTLDCPSCPPRRSRSSKLQGKDLVTGPIRGCCALQALRDARGCKPKWQTDWEGLSERRDAIMQRVNRIHLAGAALQFVSIMLLAVAAIDP
jgi:hypothetical protein